MSFDFSSWYSDLKVVVGEFAKERDGINLDRKLSTEGKQEKLGPATADLSSKVAKLRTKFNVNMSILQKNLKGILEPSLPELSDSEKMLRAIDRLSFSVQIASMDWNGISDLVTRLYEAEDLATLENLRDSVRFKHPDLALASSEYINQIKELNYNNEQREAQKKLEELSREIALFAYSLDFVDQYHEFVDARNNQGQVIDSSELAQIGHGR